MPCLDGIIYFFLTIGVKLGDKIGVRNTVILTFGLHYFSYFILIFAKNFYLFLISMVMFGIGHAISNLAVIKNCWKYFPNNTGLVYGIIVSGAGMCSSIFTPLADFIVINPEKETTDSLGFYPEYIAMRLLKYLIIVTMILGIFGALSIFFTIFFTFDKKKTEEVKIGEIIGEDKNEDEVQNKPTKKESLIESENDEIKKNEDQVQPNKASNKQLWEAFLSVKNIMFIGFCFCSFCKWKYKFNIYFYYWIVLDFLISNCNRDFGNKNHVSQNAIFTLGILFGIVNGSSRFLWGYLMDKFGFKTLMFAITTIEVTVGASLYFIVKYDAIFVICVLCVGACIGGNFVILAPTFNKIFGRSYF